MRRSLTILLFVAALSSIATPAAAQQPAPARIPSYKELKYPPLGQVKIPQPVEATLSNGMRVFLLEDHELPLVSGAALIRTGNLFDPPDKKGLSDVMAEVLRSGGTKSKTGDQLDEQLENVAGAVESGMDETSATVSFRALKESAGVVLAAFKDVLANPEFRQDKIDLSLEQFRSAIARRNDEAAAIPDRELMRILYGRDTPYGWQTEYEDLARIHRDDLVAFYRRYYFPKNVMLEVYGDFNAAEMKDQLEKLFADWKVEQPPVPPFPKVTAKPAPGVYFASKEEVTQAFFSIGELGGTLRDPDYAALEVAADILGHGFSSRLMTQIRTRLGYAYNIGAVWAADYDHPGTFRIVGSTKSATTVETIQAAQAELEKLRSAEVTEQELKEAKDGVLNAFVFNFDSPAKTLVRIVRYEYFGYPRDFLLQYQKAVAAVTREDVLRVVKEHFRPEDLAIVAVGNAKDFGKPLTTLNAKVTPIDLTIPSLKPAAGAGDAASQSRGRALLDRAAGAMGGADKLAAVRDSTETLDRAQDPSVGGMRMKLTNRFIAPATLRQEQEIPALGKVVAYTDGKSGWLATPQGVQNMSADILKQAQGELFRQVGGLVLSSRDSSRTVNALNDHTVQISSADGQVVTLEFEPSTGLPSKETYRQPGFGGNAEVVESLSDWRETGGLKMPFKISVQQNGRKLGEETVSEYRFNTGLKTEDLSKKP
jgi:zinc protease